MNYLRKLLLLAEIGLQNPAELIDRLEAIFTSRLERYLGREIDYNPMDSRRALSTFIKWLEGSIDANETKDIEDEVRTRMQALEEIAPFTTKHHGDFSLAHVCFTACRLLKPEIVVETGVAYGVTTAFILKALQLNNKGTLHSIDLPPLGKNADLYVGYLVPEYLRDRWVLHRGASKRVLLSLLEKLRHVDVFVHDSLHTYWNIKRELLLVTPHLSRPSVVIADDIHGNKAFLEMVRRQNPKEWLAFKEEGKKSVAGVALFV